MVLLVLGVAVTVGLAVMSRSITEVNISAVEDESARALEAAETGIEKALGGVIAVGGGTGSLPQVNASYNVSSTRIGSGDAYEVPQDLAAGEVATITLEGEDSLGNPATYGANQLWLCWRWQGTVEPALEAILYYRSPGASPVYYVSRNGFDPAGRVSGFVSTGGFPPNCVGGLTWPGINVKRRLISFTGDLGMPNGHVPMYLRVKPMLNTGSCKLGVVSSGGGAFPVQGKDINSVGQSGDASQRLRVIQTNPDLPTMFDSALFSGTGLSQ